LQYGNLSSLVQALRLVLASGEILELAQGDERLDGARVHLGALGVISEVTLPVQPAFQLAETVESLPVKRAIGSLQAMARSAEYVKLWWMPHAPAALVFRYQRTTEPTTRWPSPHTQRWIDDVILQKGVYPLLVQLMRARPSVTPQLNRIVSRTLMTSRRVGPSNLMLSTTMPLRHRETEAALPLSNSDEALDRVVRLITHERFYPNFPVEVRFVRGDQGWMSPAYGGDTCQLGLYSTQQPDTDRLFAGFWRELYGLGIRPHWGKEHDRPREEILAAYPQSSRFLLLRRQLDPSGLFVTEYQRRLLGA
jgi:FAD/FMN-containing dehydrogenase